MKNHLLFYALILLCVSTHIVRTVYEIRKHRKTIKATRLSFLIIFTNMFLLWVSWFALGEMDPFRKEIPDIYRYIGFFLSGSGGVIFVTALLTIKSLETYEGDLVSYGIYSIFRHPMYLGFILWITGMPLFSGSIFATYLALPFIANVLFWRYLEEKELIERFPDYPAYRKKTIF
jgi:protein-S-isoprenylcysteine O-methyltransferase Ste14